jgi:hypothetical protein
LLTQRLLGALDAIELGFGERVGHVGVGGEVLQVLVDPGLVAAGRVAVSALCGGQVRPFFQLETGTQAADQEPRPDSLR